MANITGSHMSHYVPDMTLNYPTKLQQVFNSGSPRSPYVPDMTVNYLPISQQYPPSLLPRGSHSPPGLATVVPLTNDHAQSDGSTDSDTDLDEAFSMTTDFIKPTQRQLLQWRSLSGLSIQQIKKHGYLLHILRRFPVRLSAWKQLVHHISSKWSHLSTRLNWLGSSLGAMKRRDMYVALELDHLWPPPAFIYDQMKTWKAQQLLWQNFDLPHIEAHIVETIALPLPPLPRLYLRLMFRTAQRSTSILHLLAIDMFIERHPAQALLPIPGQLQTLSLRFRDGKTITSTGAYTLHTLVTHEDAQLLQQLAKQHRFIFGASRRQIAAQVSHALRSSGYDVRSCRRGALRHLASKGVSDEALMLLSRHTSRQTLYKYLGAGLWLRSEAQQMAEMAQILLQC